MKNLKLIIILLIITFNLNGQNKKIDTLQQNKNIQFTYKSLIVPTLLIGYGIVGLENDALRNINSELIEVGFVNIDEKITIDDISQYVSFLSVYGLNEIGVKGKNNQYHNIFENQKAS